MRSARQPECDGKRQQPRRLAKPQERTHLRVPAIAAQDQLACRRSSPQRTPQTRPCASRSNSSTLAHAQLDAGRAAHFAHAFDEVAVLHGEAGLAVVGDLAMGQAQGGAVPSSLRGGTTAKPVTSTPPWRRSVGRKLQVIQHLSAPSVNQLTGKAGLVTTRASSTRMRLCPSARATAAAQPVTPAPTTMISAVSEFDSWPTLLAEGRAGWGRSRAHRVCSPSDRKLTLARQRRKRPC